MSFSGPDYEPSETRVDEYGMQGCQRHSLPDVCRYQDLGSVKVCERIEEYARKYWAGRSDLLSGTTAHDVQARGDVSSSTVETEANSGRLSENFEELISRSPSSFLDSMQWSTVNQLS